MVSVVPQHGQTALIFAVEEHETETVKTLLAAGADVNLQEKVNKTRAIYIDSADVCTIHFLVRVRFTYLKNSVSQSLRVYHTHSMLSPVS